MQQRFYKNIYGFGYNYDQLHRLVGQTNYIQKGSFFLQDRLATEYEYDENGNIELLRRQSDELFSSWMDDLDYSYQPGTNLLNSVTDDPTIDPEAETGDFDGTSDYVYDGAGNLTQETKTIGADVTTHTIEWTPYGKVRSVSGPDNTTFAYDAQQNRLMKDFNGLKTYYIRDAQGNPGAYGRGRRTRHLRTRRRHPHLERAAPLRLGASGAVQGDRSGRSRRTGRSRAFAGRSHPAGIGAGGGRQAV